MLLNCLFDVFLELFAHVFFYVRIWIHSNARHMFRWSGLPMRKNRLVMDFAPFIMYQMVSICVQHTIVIMILIETFRRETRPINTPIQSNILHDCSCPLNPWNDNHLDWTVYVYFNWNARQYSWASSLFPINNLESREFIDTKAIFFYRLPLDN